MGISTTCRHLPDPPVFIGLTGHTGCGKTTAAEYLASRYGFESIRYSLVLRSWQGESAVSKQRLQEVGWDLMKSGRQGELNQQLLARLKTYRSTVIDGLRHPVDFECLSQALGDTFALLFIQTDRSLRMLRTQSRFDSVLEFEASEEQCVESFIPQLLPRSSAVIVNDGSLNQFHAELDAVVGRLFSEAAA